MDIGVCAMTPLDQSIQALLATYPSALNLLIIGGLVMLPLAIVQYAESHCFFGHSFRLYGAKNDNGIWTSEYKCRRCDKKMITIGMELKF